MLIGWNIKIQSISDVITNSSTEIYVEATEHTLNGIKNIVNSILKSVNSEYTADNLFEFSLEDIDKDIDTDYPYKRNYIVTPKKPEYKYAAVALCNLDQLFNMEAVFE